MVKFFDGIIEILIPKNKHHDVIDVRDGIPP